MKKSVRAIRMERHHKRMSKDSKLSLVSLMDIFTILVFFLMVNASDVQVLQNNKSVELPTSNAKQAAKETLLLVVNQNDLIIQGRKVADVASLLKNNLEIIPELEAELQYQAKRSPEPGRVQNEDGSLGEPLGRAITVMGDKTIPYTLLKRIMQTCSQVGYTNIALAVDSTAAQKAAEAANQSASQGAAQ